MQRIGISIYEKRIVLQVGYLQEYCDILHRWLSQETGP